MTPSEFLMVGAAVASAVATGWRPSRLARAARAEAGSCAQEVPVAMAANRAFVRRSDSRMRRRSGW